MVYTAGSTTGRRGVSSCEWSTLQAARLAGEVCRRVNGLHCRQHDWQGARNTIGVTNAFDVLLSERASVQVWLVRACQQACEHGHGRTRCDSGKCSQHTRSMQ